jgi:NACHT domain.
MTAVYAQEQEVLKWTALSDSELSQATNTQAASLIDKMAAISRKLDADLPRLIDTSLVMRHSIDKKMISNILSWLCMVPTTLHLRDIATSRMPGSGLWLLNHTEFHTWHTSSSSAILLLHGVRGCGKSTIASFVVDQFQQPPVVPGGNPVTCAYFFCDDSNAEPERGRADSILRGLIRQLAVDSVTRSIDQAVLSAYEKRLEAAQQMRVDMARLNVEECLSMLLDLTATNPAYIVIDAIDQLGQDERAVLIETMKKLVDQSASIIKVFFTSCNNAHVEALLLGNTKLRVTSDCVQTDVRGFANRQVEEANARRRVLNGTATSKLIDKMKEHLISRAGEM